MARSVDFLFSGMAPQPSAEAAARRRIRALENVHPGAQEWDVRLYAAPRNELSAPLYEAQVAARLGRAALQGEARGSDLLSALRLAFNAIEVELDMEREGARARAAQWLAAVRSRIGIRPGFL